MSEVTQHSSGADRDLTEKERRLIGAIVHAASRGTELTREQAGTAAGYGRGQVARVQASRALARPVVKAALMDALRDTAQADAAGAYAIVRHLGMRSTSDRVRLDAAQAGLRMAGMDVAPQVPGGPAIIFRLHLDADLQAMLDATAHPATRTAPLIEGTAEAPTDG